MRHNWQNSFKLPILKAARPPCVEGVSEAVCLQAASALSLSQPTRRHPTTATAHFQPWLPHGWTPTHLAARTPTTRPSPAEAGNDARCYAISPTFVYPVSYLSLLPLPTPTLVLTVSTLGTAMRPRWLHPLGMLTIRPTDRAPQRHRSAFH